jgi:hypothetical protein
MEGVAIGHNFERGPSKDNSSKAWSKLVQWFLRRLKCEKLMTDDDGRRTKPDGKSSPGLRPGELNMNNNDPRNSTQKLQTELHEPH